MGIFRINNPIPDIGPDTVFNIGGFPVTNSTLMMVFIALLIMVVAFILRKKDNLIPDKIQNFAEASYEMMFDLINQVTGNRKVTGKIFPLIGALLVFILVANVAGLIPGLNEITVAGIPLFRSPTTDFNTTFGLSLALLILIQIVSINDAGIFKYLGRFFQFKQVYNGFKSGIKDGFVAIIMFIIGLLDIISEIAKVVSLSLRLFGNMYAGQVLSIVILAGFAYGLPALWMSLNMLSAVVQTLVFALLVTAYYSTSVEIAEEKEELLEN